MEQLSRPPRIRPGVLPTGPFTIVDLMGFRNAPPGRLDRPARKPAPLSAGEDGLGGGA